jgi:hypothetical protein
MEESTGLTLEKALSKVEEDVISTIKSNAAVNSALKKLLSAARQGKLKDLATASDLAEKAESVLRQQISALKAKWDFNEQEYLAGGSYSKELLNVAQDKGLSLYERDDRLYCYPTFIRVLPGDRAVMIGKTIEKRIRPSFLIGRLKELQKRPVRFNAGAFIESLHAAYDKVVRLKTKGLLEADRVIPLLDIYELFTLLPGQSKDYSKQEFARDIYLLDSSDIVATRSGAKIRFAASTGTKAGRVISIIDERGAERKYYAVSFSKG